MQKKLEEFKDLLTNPDYEYRMHGTGRAGDDDKEQAGIIASIFQKGLRTYKGRLFLTTEYFGDGENMQSNWDSIKDAMDNWPHMGSENIIILRLPKKYINEKASEESGDREIACCVEVDEGNEEPTKYINPKFIVGCYHAKTGNVTLNPNFEKELTPETEKILQEKYEKGLADNARILAYTDPPFTWDKNRGQENPCEENDTKLSNKKLTMDDTERLFD